MSELRFQSRNIEIDETTWLLVASSMDAPPDLTGLEGVLRSLDRLTLRQLDAVDRTVVQHLQLPRDLPHLIARFDDRKLHVSATIGASFAVVRDGAIHAMVNIDQSIGARPWHDADVLYCTIDVQRGDRFVMSPGDFTPHFNRTELINLLSSSASLDVGDSMITTALLRGFEDPLHAFEIGVESGVKAVADDVTVDDFLAGLDGFLDLPDLTLDNDFSRVDTTDTFDQPDFDAPPEPPDLDDDFWAEIQHPLLRDRLSHLGLLDGKPPSVDAVRALLIEVQDLIDDSEPRAEQFASNNESPVEVLFEAFERRMHPGDDESAERILASRRHFIEETSVLLERAPRDVRDHLESLHALMCRVLEERSRVLYLTPLNDEVNALRGQLEQAGRAQHLLFPRPVRAYDGVECINYSVSLDAAGGDYCTTFSIGDGRILFLIGDVTGHGVGAAVFTGVVAGALDVARVGMGKKLTSPKLARMLSVVLTRRGRREFIMTAIIGVLDTKTGKLELLSAGHTAPLILTSSGTKALRMPPQPPLGAVPSHTYRAAEATLQKGESLFLYTDGVTEAANAKGRQYGLRKLRAFIAANAKLHPDTLVQRIKADVDAHTAGHPREDDMSIQIIRRT